jgi:glutamyl-tRNA synthetase
MMGVNQVIRGADLVTSTPRQILLYQALGRPLPTFGHVPLAIDAGGRRLAKRDNALKLTMLRQAGVDAKLLIGSLVRSCGWSDAVIPSMPRDWINAVSLSKLSPGPWVITPSWIDAIHPGS